MDSNLNKILVTGSSGFVGKALTSRLAELGYQLFLPVRSVTSTNSHNIFFSYINDISDLPDRVKEFGDIDCVIHVAASAHSPQSSIDDFREINVKATLDLAIAASNAGVKRFIFLSSIGVNGSSTYKPFKFDDEPQPSEAYSLSKFEAEIGLKKICSNVTMELVIIRPPLVYGHGAPGNFGKLVKLAKSQVPLPLGAINNQRSLIGIDNLVDLIITCINHSKATNQLFLASDGYDVSTTQLIRMISEASGSKSLLLPIPLPCINFFASLFGKKQLVDKLCSDLQIDITYTKETLGWQPPVSLQEGISRCFL